MSRYKFPASLPRKMYWSDEVGGCATCPDCSEALESEHHTYMMATRHAGCIDLHMVGNSAGHFCGNCPGVVFDRNEFERFASLAVGEAGGAAYIVMGIVDLDAVPENKRSLPFDDDSNPVPLVEFTNRGKRHDSGTPSPRRPSNKKQEKRKKSR